MKIDYEYLGTILQVFIDADKAHITVFDIEESGVQVKSTIDPNRFDERFIFHVQIALDNELISDKHGQVNGLDTIGIKISHRMHTMLDTPVRLTQNGHDFAAALNNSEIMNKLKSEFKDAPFKVIFDGSQKLLQHFFKKKMDSMLSE